jgi:O-antigen/teichoic acid export membrane protein
MVTAVLRRLALTFREAWNIAISRQKRRDVLRTPLYANSVYLMANSAATAVLGFLFWILVARFYPAEALGLGSALISAAGLLAFVASLGLGMGLIRFLPGAGASGPKLINSSFTLTGLAAVAVSVIFIAGLSLWSPALAFVRGNAIFVIAFVAFVVAGTLFSLLTQALVALRKAQFVLIQGLLAGLIKVVLVIAMASLFQVFGIFASWGVSTAAALALGILLFLPRLQPGYRPFPAMHRQVSNEMLHFSFANYTSAGLWNLPTWLLPIIIVNVLGGESNAYFYVSWAMAGLLFAIPSAISISMFAEGSHQEGMLTREVRRSLKLIVILLLPAVVIMLAAGDKLLLVFGREYSVQGAKLLWVLAPSAIPVSVNLVYLGIAQVKKRLKDIVLVAAAVAAGTLGLSYALIPHMGVLGPGVGWLVTHTLVALAVLPRLRGSLRPAEPQQLNSTARDSHGDPNSF